jgi:hypothetical protein
MLREQIGNRRMRWTAHPYLSRWRSFCKRIFEVWMEFAVAIFSTYPGFFKGSSRLGLGKAFTHSWREQPIAHRITDHDAKGISQ